MIQKDFIGTCVENPFNRIETLVEITETAKPISKSWFIRNCAIHPEIKAQMQQFPDDYEYFSYRNIMFFTWSAIEHFYE